MKAQPATQETIQTTPSKCNSGPDCPCEFCFSLRAKHAEGRSEKDIKTTREDFFPLVFAQASLSRIGIHRHHFQSNFPQSSLSPLIFYDLVAARVLLRPI